MSKKYWTEEENKHITQIYKLYDRKELAEIFECTERQIYTKLRKLGLITVESNKIPEGCKKCNICNEIRSLDEFYNNKSKFDGKASECKHCAREMSIIKLRKKKAEKERLQEEAKKQQYIDSLEGKELICKHHGVQTIDDYRIYKSHTGRYSRKCKKCERDHQQKINAKRLKEKGFI